MKTHLEKGSQRPPLHENSMRIYSMRFCPFAQRTHLMLLHKQIPHDIVYVHLLPARKPEWLFGLNPLGKVPVLQTEDTVVYDSPICNDYLDEVFPETRLSPRDPYQKAQERMKAEHFNKVISVFFRSVKESFTATEADTIVEEFFRALDPFEDTYLTGKYFGGDNPSQLDFSIWPFIERLPAVERLVGKTLLPESRYQRLHSWIARMGTLQAVSDTRFSTEDHLRFLKSYIRNEPDYDFVL